MTMAHVVEVRAALSLLAVPQVEPVAAVPEVVRVSLLMPLLLPLLLLLLPPVAMLVSLIPPLLWMDLL